MEETYSYNDMTYKEVIKSEDKVYCDILHKKKKPDNIYKFYSINQNSISSLVNGYLYASHPFELNDNLDSNILLITSSKRLDFSYYRVLLEKCFKTTKDLIDFYENDNQEGAYSHGFISLFWDTISNIFGIISLTGVEKNELMWPHYTQEKGFQVKFNTVELEKSINENQEEDTCYGLFPINYTKELNPIDISDFTRPTIPFYYATNIKSIKWIYEDEWRFIISKNHMGVPYSKSPMDSRQDSSKDKSNRYTYYDKNIVKEITLGHNFFTSSDFSIERLNDKKSLIIEPLKYKNSKFDDYCILLDYISESLNDKLYYSGSKYLLNTDKVPYLTRTKERFDIVKIDNTKYKLTRSNEVHY